MGDRGNEPDRLEIEVQQIADRIGKARAAAMPWRDLIREGLEANTAIDDETSAAFEMPF